MGGKGDSSLGGHKQNLVHTKTWRKGAVTLQETEPKLPASVRGSPVEVSQQMLTTGIGGLAAAVLDSPFGVNTLGVTIKLTIEPTDLRAGSPQAKKLPWMELSPIHQQIIELKLYCARAWPP